MATNKNLLIYMLGIGLTVALSSIDSSKVDAQANKNKADYGRFNKSADSLYTLASSFRATANYKESIETSLAYLDYTEKNKSNIDSTYLEERYDMYMQIVMGYAGLGQWDKAKLYQNKLHEAFQQKKLPNGWNNNHYCFDYFEWNGLRIFGYEYFPEFGYPKTEESLSKYVYHVENKKKILFSLETLKNNNQTSDGSEFMFLKDENTKDQNVVTNTYTNPIDYKKLHDAVVAYLKSDVPATNK